MDAVMTRFGTSEPAALSDERLRHARDTYRPTNVVPTGEMAFAHWSERVAAQPALVTARELSGLTHENLDALAAEFDQAPRMRQKNRWLTPTGIGMALLGALMIVMHEMSAEKSSMAALAIVGGAALVAGLMTMGVATMRSLQNVPLDRAYGLLGLYVGDLNERHPWLYKTVLLTHNAAAEAYRVRVLTERGVLRGVDYVMMEEIALAHENMELTTTARTMRERVQSLPKPSQP